MQGAPVLVVEDDHGIRQTIQWALEDEGLLVTAAGNGRDGIRRAQDQRPRLVILDWSIPLLRGDAFAQALRSSYADPIPILLVTADGRVEEKARTVGAAGWLAKPFEISELLAEVNRILAA